MGAIVVERLPEMVWSAFDVSQMNECDPVFPLLEKRLNVSSHSEICPLAEREAMGRAVT